MEPKTLLCRLDPDGAATCGTCGQRVAPAPTGQAMIDRGEVVVICAGCVRDVKVINLQPFTEAQLDEIQRACGVRLTPEQQQRVALAWLRRMCE